MQPSSSSYKNNSLFGNSLSSSKDMGPFRVEIDLDRQIYNPCQTISGGVKLVLSRKLYCDVLLVRLYGSARVFFTEMLKTPGSVGQNRAYEQEIVMVDNTTDLWTAYGPHNSGTEKQPKRDFSLDDIARIASSNTIRMPTSLVGNGSAVDKGREKEPGLNAGVHEFSFSFKLPSEDQLYTSFDAKNSAGYVRYYIMIQALNSGHTSLKRKLLFPVVCPRDLSKDPVLSKLANKSVELEESKFLEKGKVTARLVLKKRGYVPGEPLQGQITIENRSPKSIKYSNLRIIQRTVCYSKRPEIKVHESFFETPGMGLPTRKLGSNDVLNYPIRFYVPALLPNLDIPECIEASYCLCLDVDWKRTNHKHMFIQMKTPLIIGTHPTSDMAKQLHGLPEAPPSYESTPDEMMTSPLADMPPSYALSVGGMSEINGKRHEENLQGHYTPFCYHYAFAEDDALIDQLKEKAKLE